MLSIGKSTLTVSCRSRKAETLNVALVGQEIAEVGLERDRPEREDRMPPAAGCGDGDTVVMHGDSRGKPRRQIGGEERAYRRRR